MKTIDELINEVWPKDNRRNVNIALDEHEIHYGLHFTHDDVLKGIGQ